MEAKRDEYVDVLALCVCCTDPPSETSLLAKKIKVVATSCLTRARARAGARAWTRAS